jgi:hypothetical protein
MMSTAGRDDLFGLAAPPSSFGERVTDDQSRWKMSGPGMARSETSVHAGSFVRTEIVSERPLVQAEWLSPSDSGVAEDAR